MHFIIESMRPCGHNQREMIDAKSQDEAVKIGEDHSKDICDGCALIHVLKWRAFHGKEPNA